MLLLDILGNDRVQRISHLMGHTRVDHFQDLVRSFLNIVENASRNVNELKHYLVVKLFQLNLGILLVFRSKVKDHVGELMLLLALHQVFDTVNFLGMAGNGPGTIY